MRKVLLALSVMLASMAANAGLVVQDYDLQDYITYDDYSSGSAVEIRKPNFFENGWINETGDTEGYVSFEAYTNFAAVMYLVGDDGYGNYSDVIAYGQAVGNQGPFGRNQKIEGYLDPIQYIDGTYAADYSVIVGPEGLTEEMVKNNDFSIIDDYFSSDNPFFAMINPIYTLVATYPTGLTPPQIKTRTEDTETLNDQYFERIAANEAARAQVLADIAAVESANVSEPTTLSLLALSLFGAFYARRRKAA